MLSLILFEKILIFFKETFDNHKDEYEDYLSQLSLGSKGYDVALSEKE